jgi:hypothetical protein
MNNEILIWDAALKELDKIKQSVKAAYREFRRMALSWAGF